MEQGLSRYLVSFIGNVSKSMSGFKDFSQKSDFHFSIIVLRILSSQCICQHLIAYHNHSQNKLF